MANNRDQGRHFEKPDGKFACGVYDCVRKTKDPKKVTCRACRVEVGKGIVKKTCKYCCKTLELKIGEERDMHMPCEKRFRVAQQDLQIYAKR